MNKVDQLYHLGSNPARSAANVTLFAFLASYRISPAGWGFGEPRNASGYTSSLEVVARRRREHGQAEPGGLRGACGSRSRTSGPAAGNRIAGHLAVRARLVVRLPALGPLVLGRARLARRPHRIPVRARRAGRGGDEARRQAVGGRAPLLAGLEDARDRATRARRTGSSGTTRTATTSDIWAVLSRRFYGQFNSPSRQARPDRASTPGREDDLVVDVLRRRRQPRLQRRRAALRPAHVPALERARGRSRARSTRRE